MGLRPQVMSKVPPPPSARSSKVPLLRGSAPTPVSALNRSFRIMDDVVRSSSELYLTYDDHMLRNVHCEAGEAIQELPLVPRDVSPTSLYSVSFPRAHMSEPALQMFQSVGEFGILEQTGSHSATKKKSGWKSFFKSRKDKAAKSVDCDVNFNFQHEGPAIYDSDAPFTDEDPFGNYGGRESIDTYSTNTPSSFDTFVEGSQNSGPPIASHLIHSHALRVVPMLTKPPKPHTLRKTRKLNTEELTKKLRLPPRSHNSPEQQLQPEPYKLPKCFQHEIDRLEQLRERAAERSEERRLARLELEAPDGGEDPIWFIMDVEEGRVRDVHFTRVALPIEDQDERPPRLADNYTVFDPEWNFKTRLSPQGRSTGYAGVRESTRT